MAIRPMMVKPSQYALKFPATNPERILSDAPPSRDDVTTSFTWLDSTDVNTLTSSGVIAPASVPQVIMLDSFHHIDVSLPISGIIRYEIPYVAQMEMIEVNHTSEVSGAS